MTLLQSLALGLIQGIAEFLPISSSGHLKIAQTLLSLDDVPLLFDVCLHMATLAAVLIYFRKVVARLFSILLRWLLRRPADEHSAESGDGKIRTLAPSEKAGRKTILMILLTTLITGVLGVLSAKFVPDVPPKVVAMGFLVTSILLILSAVAERKFRRTDERGEIVFSGISAFQAAVVGIAQGIGTLPGISRSGATISGALFAKVDRITAGDYSFIVSIPAIAGAFVLELKDLGALSAAVSPAPIAVGCAAAFTSGYLALSVLMKLISKGKLEYFAAYLIPAAIAVTWLL